MISTLSKICFVVLLGLFGARAGFAQTTAGDMPDPIRENLAKQKIKQDEKDYEDLVKRGEEAVKLSEELSKSFEENSKLSEADQKKLEKLEKVVKRIRRDLGAEEDDAAEKEEKPATTIGTLETIKEKTANLLKELKKASRYSISVVAVETSNAVVRLINFLKFGRKL